MKYLWLALLLSACSANPACDPQRWADLLIAVPAVPYCAIRVAENQCGPQGCGGIPQGRSGNYTILGPGNDVAFVIAN